MKVDIEIKNDGQPSRRFPMEVEAREMDRRNVFAFLLWFLIGFGCLTALGALVGLVVHCMKGSP